MEESDKKVSKLKLLADDDGSGRRLRPATTVLTNLVRSPRQRQPRVATPFTSFVCVNIFIYTSLFFFIPVCTSRSVCYFE